ncbi:MAG: OmpA family protein [Flavobacteriales bacterium]|nr:OmpA family protein [Flavobacteriales bacterium]
MRNSLLLALISVLTQPILAQDKLTQHFYFQTDSFNITSAHEDGLKRLQRELTLNPYYRIRMDGNTDSIGDRSYNLELSKKRVTSIRNELIRRGIRADRIKMEAKGEDWPQFSNATEHGKSRNRRVDVFVLLDKDSCFKDGCAQTCIPKGTFDPYFTYEIDIKFIPITNVEQMRTNNISAQTVDGGYLFSSGMIQVIAEYKGRKVYPKKPAKLRIPAYKLDETFTIYEGNSSGNSSVNWKESALKAARGNDGCKYFELDGSIINRWVNIDKPRPANNMICLDNPFAYLDMPAIDSDTSKIIDGDIVLALPQNSFDSSDLQALQIKSERVQTLCQMLDLRMTSITENSYHLGRDRDILHIDKFEVKGVEVEPQMAAFNLYFPAKKIAEDATFYVAEEKSNGTMEWTNAGKADSIYEIKGCDCKYVVKSFSYPTRFINVSTEERQNEVKTSQLLVVKKHQPEELFVYNKSTKTLELIEPNDQGKYSIDIGKRADKLIIIGRYKGDDGDYVFDNTLTRFRKRWFRNERVVNAKHYRKVDPRKGLKLKSVSCRTRI